MRMKSLIFPAAACAMLFAGCGRDKPEPPPVVAYIDGALIQSPEARSEFVREILAPGADLDIEDAAFILVQRFRSERAGVPEEAVFFGRLTLAPNAVSGLKARMRPGPRPEYAAPDMTPDWWPDQAGFEAMDFHELEGIFQYPTTFAAIAPNNDLMVLSTKP